MSIKYGEPLLLSLITYVNDQVEFKCCPFGGNLKSNIEINVLLNLRPMCLFRQPMAVLMVRDPVITVQNNFNHYYRFGASLLYNG